MEEVRKETPGIDQVVNRQVQEYISTQNKTTTTPTVYYIPVVVHVVHTGGAIGSVYNPNDAIITAALDYLNAVYDGTWEGSGGTILGAGDIQLRFVLASKDPDNNPTTGINRVNAGALSGYISQGVRLSSSSGVDELMLKELSHWDPSRYYNIWIVNKIDGLDGTSGSFVAGYATFPPVNNTTTSSLKRDGIVMLATQMTAGAKTLPHEIGHAFNLYHPFQGEGIINWTLNTCPSNANPSNDGDFCADTDPIINPADDGYGTSAFSCRTGSNSCSGSMFNDNTELNFMNYTTCYRLFTEDQKTRMLAAAANSTRNGLATSWANNQGNYPTTWLAPVPAAVTPVTAGNYPNAIGIMSVSLNDVTIYSLNATQDGGYVNNVKWYNLFQVLPGTTYNMTVGLLNSGYYEQVGVWIDYDGNGVFNDAAERVFFNNTSSPTNLLSVNFTTPATLSGGIVRMRIMTDYSPAYGMPQLSGSSASIYAGQAEDYPVYLKNVAPLPVKLAKFTGKVTRDGNLLEWKTVQESNTKEFQVERSVNGSEFKQLGIVEAKGNTSTETSYRFMDNTVETGNHVYRLKIVDLDQHFTYSNSISLKIQDPSGIEIVGNPFINSVKIKVAQNSSVSIRLMDISGRILARRMVAQTTGSIIEMPVASSLSTGVYFLEAIVNNQKTVHKLIKE